MGVFSKANAVKLELSKVLKVSIESSLSELLDELGRESVREVPFLLVDHECRECASHGGMASIDRSIDTDRQTEISSSIPDSTTTTQKSFSCVHIISFVKKYVEYGKKPPRHTSLHPTMSLIRVYIIWLSYYRFEQHTNS